MRIILLLFLAATASTAQAGLYLTVDPSRTEAHIRRINGDHMILPPQNQSNGLLLITFGGTNSTPDEFLDFQLTASAQGYHVLGIDYPNRVITTVCRKNQDAECFDKFRTEIVSGVPVSAVTEVDAANCILNRIRMLLGLLVRESWPGQWSQFLNEDGQLNWRRVVLAGHSQGSGHAAYLSQLFAVEGVILLAGPQDVSQLGPAGWLDRVGHTPGENYYALLHEADPFGVDWQIQAARRLSRGAGQIIVSRMSVPNPHMSVLTRAFEKAWIMMLNRPYLKKEKAWEKH